LSENILVLNFDKNLVHEVNRWHNTDVSVNSCTETLVKLMEIETDMA